MTERLEVPAGPDVVRILPRVEAALAGRATLVPHAEGTPAPDLGDERPNADTALVIGTSGSTGDPKYALLTADNLRSSAEATHRILGGTGSWLLAMPAHHVAGFHQAPGHQRVAAPRTLPVAVGAPHVLLVDVERLARGAAGHQVQCLQLELVHRPRHAGGVDVAAHQQEIGALLEDYGVPLFEGDDE